MAYNTAEYMIGGGEVQLASYGSVEYETLGSCPQLEIEMVVDVTEHWTPIYGIQQLDDQTVVKTGYTLKFQCDQINEETLAMFFFANAAVGDTLHALTNVEQYFTMRYVPHNTKGQKWTHTFHKMQMKPTGSLKLISDKEYASVGFEAKGFLDAVANPTSPWFTSVKSS